MTGSRIRVLVLPALVGMVATVSPVLYGSDSLDRYRELKQVDRDLIDAARKKVAQALVEGKEIFIMGGSVYFRNNIMRCLNCGTIIPIGFENNVAIKCPNCGGTDFINLAQQFGFGQCHRRGHRHCRR